VAGSDEMAEAVLQEIRNRRDGLRQAGAFSTLWRWEEASLSWLLVRVEGRDPDPVEEHFLQDHCPTAPPDVRLTAIEQCRIRHRLNFRAAWAREEHLTWSTGGRVASGEDAGPNE
jgi:hypothetical protein